MPTRPSPVGLHRVLEPSGESITLPQAARRLDARPELWDDEVRIDVETLNLDAASYRQLAEKHTVDGRVDGALFTAMKVYENGSTQAIEGVFMNRTAYHSPTDTKGDTSFGLGVDGNMVVMGSIGVNRFFFTRR